MVLHELDGPGDQLEVVARHRPQGGDHVGVGGEPVDGLGGNSIITVTGCGIIT